MSKETHRYPWDKHSDLTANLAVHFNGWIGEMFCDYAVHCLNQGKLEHVKVATEGIVQLGNLLHVYLRKLVTDKEALDKTEQLIIDLVAHQDWSDDIAPGDRIMWAISMWTVHQLVVMLESHCESVEIKRDVKMMLLEMNKYLLALRTSFQDNPETIARECGKRRRGDELARQIDDKGCRDNG